MMKNEIYDATINGIDTTYAINKNTGVTFWEDGATPKMKVQRGNDYYIAEGMNYIVVEVGNGDKVLTVETPAEMEAMLAELFPVFNPDLDEDEISAEDAKLERVINEIMKKMQ